MLRTFIERPVLSTVISIIIVILGVLGLTQLPVTQYPDIANGTGKRLLSRRQCRNHRGKCDHPNRRTDQRGRRNEIHHLQCQ